MFVIDDIINAIGAGIASNQQQGAADKAMDVWKPIWQQQQDNFNPFVEAGTGALGSLTDLARTGPQQLRPQDVANDPGYQFQLEQGMKALQRSAAAKGTLNSGGTLKGLADYSGGLAATQYQNAWNRNQQAYQQRFGDLGTLANMGMGAANSLGTFGNNYGTAMANLYGAKGNAQAAGTMGVTNAMGQVVKDVGNYFTMGMGGMMGGGGGGGGGMGGMLGGLFGGGGGIPTQGG